MQTCFSTVITAHFSQGVCLLSLGFPSHPDCPTKGCLPHAAFWHIGGGWKHLKGQNGKDVCSRGSGRRGEKRTNHRQTSEEIYWNWSFLVSSIQGHLYRIAKEPSPDLWPALVLKLPRQHQYFFQQRFSDWNWILLPFAGKKKLRPLLTSLNFLQKRRDFTKNICKIVRFRSNWVQRDPTPALIHWNLAAESKSQPEDAIWNKQLVSAVCLHTAGVCEHVSP